MAQGMLNKLKSLLQLEQGQGSARLTEDKPEPRVAVCAVLLEVAHADGVFDPAEREAIRAALGAEYGLDAAEVDELIALTEAERAKHPDLWAFTHAIGRAYTPAEKLSVLVMVWQVIFADDVLDAHEDMLVRQLQPMLAVNHSVVIEAKAIAREKSAAPA